MAALQPALQEATKAAQHDDDGPDQPEAGETGQEGVGALWHHHGGDGTGWEFPLRQEEVISNEQEVRTVLQRLVSPGLIRRILAHLSHSVMKNIASYDADDNILCRNQKWTR